MLIQVDNSCDIAMLSSELAKIHKKLFGKGPNVVNVCIQPNMVVFKAEGVLTQLEKNLLQTEQGEKAVQEIRAALINGFKAVIIQDINGSLGASFSQVMAELFVAADELILVFV